jgi:hypothetical protein
MEQHATGAAVVQTMSRLAIPTGLALTSAIYSTFDMRTTNAYPELPFTNVFWTMLAVACCCVSLVPFIRIGKLVPALHTWADHRAETEAEERDRRSTASRGFRLLSGPPEVAGDAQSPRLVRKKAFTDLAAPIRPRTSSLLGSRASHQPNGPRVGSRLSSLISIDYLLSQADNPRSIPAPGALGIRNRDRALSPFERVVWLVCEDCGSHQRVTDDSVSTSAPTRYFYDERGSLSVLRRPDKKPAPITAQNRAVFPVRGRDRSGSGRAITVGKWNGPSGRRTGSEWRRARAGSRSASRVGPLDEVISEEGISPGRVGSKGKEREMAPIGHNDGAVVAKGRYGSRPHEDEAEEGIERSDSLASIATMLRRFPSPGVGDESLKPGEKFAGAVLQLKEATQGRTAR